MQNVMEEDSNEKEEGEKSAHINKIYVCVHILYAIQQQRRKKEETSNGNTIRLNKPKDETFGRMKEK